MSREVSLTFLPGIMRLPREEWPSGAQAMVAAPIAIPAVTALEVSRTGQVQGMLPPPEMSRIPTRDELDIRGHL